MKRKQFFFALVAMLSFVFSGFAQTTVTTEAELKAALKSTQGGSVVLGGNITVSSPVIIPNGPEVVLNLNGKTLKATNAKTKVLENQGKLTINGQGTVSGIIYNGTANGSAAEMTLNGGTYSLDGNNGGLHHYGKTLTINDGVVVKTTSYGVRMAGKGSVLNLNGGTYTSTGSGDMARPLALSNGTVNFLDSDITVNGYMHVMVGQVTVNFGENNQYSPFEAYHQGNSYASSVFYCKTLAEAIRRTGFAAVTLVKNVKVADGAPITVNKEIDLDLNGKNLSATNAKTTVLKNYANLTINGKGTVTGLVYNGDADNKGVAEMTLNGGTYKLDGANGGFFNYGKTLTVNDGVTISSQVYGLRMSNAASVINLNGGTFTSTNPTDNMKRAIAVDAGTINFNDDDITINGYFHANRSKAKVNFGEYCPFDAFMCSTTNASGYYVVNLENAIDKANAGYEIVLQKNLERSEIVTLPKKVTLDGNGKTLTSTAGRAINVDCADVVTIENLTIAGAAGCERGINIINKAGTTNLKKVNVSGVSYYAVHVATSAGAAQVNIENSNLTGWAAVAAYGEGGAINVKNSNLVGVNTYADQGSNDFATIAAASNIAVNVTGGKVTAESSEGKAKQNIVCGDRGTNVTTGASFTLDTELELKGTAEFVNIDLDKNTVTVREVYGTNYVTTPAGNGLVTLTGASEAMIGDVKYSTIAQAFAAAKEGETITLIADVAPMLVSQRAITKAAVIDLNGKRLTLNNADLYFGTTTFKNGTIVVAPSVNASTAVFWMFENQALAFDNVDIVATGVTGTYLIGINGGKGTTVDIINGSSITIDNESKANLTAVICDNGTGNTVTIKGSDIDVKNIEGRFYLGGKNGAVVVENTDVDLNGVKEGFYLRAGQSLDIAGTSKVNVVLNSIEGRYGINVTDATAKYTKAETATVNATVFEKKGGNDFNGYTNKDGIWGEVWGNAKESFVIKVLDAKGNVMGTTSLNNIGGIIDGEVNVTWSILFDAPTPNPAAYWSMEWTTAPSISNMPARVALWVDGVEVSGGSVVLNAPDDLDKIVAAVTDADGKIISCHTSVANAAATNATNIALLRDTNEELSLPVGTILNKNGFNADKVTVKQPVVSINGKQFATFAEALDAVENGQTITLINGVTGDEKSTKIEFTKDINFTITGKAPQYALPVVTFQNAEVTIKDAEILIPELDARQNAVINVVNSTVHDAGGNSIAKSYYNGTINIDKTSTVYMMQITTMGYINVAGTVNATWQTNVYGNGMISLAQGATFNTGALHLTGQDYSNRDNTDTDRVGKPATIVVDGATLNVGSVKSDNGSDYSYNSSKGINVGTVDGKSALLDVKKGGAVNFHMANGQTTNFGAGATVNVDASALKTICRDENGTVTLANKGTVVVTGNSQLDVKNYSGNAILLNNGNLVDTYFAGRVDAFGTNNISGTTTIGGILGLGYETNPTEQVVVNITGNFTGKNVLVCTNNGIDNILNVGKGDGERTKVHFAQLGAFADVNVVNADVTYGYAFIRNDFNATNSTFEIKGGVNTYFSGNAKVVLDNSTWALPGYANIGSYGGYMYGNADVTLKNGSSMTATSLGVEVSGENVVKLTLEDNSSLTATKLTNQGSIVLASVTASLNSNECANVTTSVPNQVVSYIDGKYTLVAAIAQIGGTAYTSLQAAINAVKDGETITLVDDVTGNITLTEKVGLHYTIDGAGKTMNGKIVITPLSDENDNRRITIKGIKFVNTADAAVDFISCAVTNHYPRLTVEGCTFTGNGKNTDVALRLKTAYGAVIKDCTGTGLHSFLQNTAGKNFTIEDVMVTESKGAFALGTVQRVTIKGSTIDVVTYGIRMDANTYNNNAVIESNNVKAFIPVVVRYVNTQSNVTFIGENTFTAKNTDEKWMVIGKEEYEENGKLPAETAEGNVVVALNGANLSYDGVHGAGLAGKGTAEEPYLINNVAELEIFRNSVNAGSTKYSKPGLCVALGADIDMTGVNWVGIGSATKDHGFMGNFDGKNFKIKNLTINNPALDSDGYAYAGLFGVTEGTDKDNQNVIKNLTIENVTINTTGDIVSAAIAYPYYTIVENVKVCGNIAITGGNYTAGVLAYTRRCVNASNLSIVGGEDSFVKGNQTVGGVISDIQMNGGLTAVYSNFSADGITVTGEKSVGGIAGIIATQTLNGATVKNVTLYSRDEFAGVVAGRLGGTSTISNVVSEYVTGATAVIGATFDGAKAVEARIGDTYYSAFAAAYTAAKANETVTMLVDLTMSEKLTIEKSIVIDGNGCTFTYTGSGESARAIDVPSTSDVKLDVTIKNLTVNCTASYCQRGINYNDDGKLTLDNVTVKGTNVTYALNLPGSADNAEVTIKNSNLTGNIALNVWGENSVVNVENTTLTAVDNSTAEGYAAVKLNNDGTTAAEGTVINIIGGVIDVAGSACEDTEAVSNATSNGEINISESTVVNGEVTTIVAVIRYNNGYSYSFQTIEAAIAKAEAGETVTLLRDVTVAEPVAINKAITLDGNNKTLTYTGASRAITVENNADANIDVTIKNLTINNTASYTERGINYNENGTLTLENVTVNGEHTTYAINLPGMSQNAKVVIEDSKFTGLIALNIWGANAQVTAENSEFYSVDHSAAEGYAAIKLNNNGSTAANGSTVVINGGKVIAKDENGAASIAVEDCTNGSTVTISAETEVVGSTTKSVAIISYGSQFYTFSTIEEAIAEAKDGETIELISDVTISYGARDLLATAAADKAVTIDGKGHTLTLNQTNSDWSSIGLENNNKLVLKNMTVNKAGKGATSGAWNTHAIIFSTAVEMVNVTVNNSVAVAADAAFTDVVFKEANGYYSLWIEANGQTVTVKGGSMTATNGGRGIKIADQYINDPAKVKLSVDGTEFSTAKKAAVLVSSKAGAEITAANVNIENVVDDKVNFVWVDGDWATYFGNVTVNGAPAVMEDAASFVAAVTVNGAVKAYYATIIEAIEAVQAGEAVELVADITASEVILLGKSLTINGNGYKVTSNATRVFRVTAANTEVTLNNVNMVNTAVRVGTNDIRGISVDDVTGVKLTLNNCSVDFTDASACDWSYAVNVVGGSGHVVTVNGGSYEGANVINVRGANQTVTVKDAVLTSLYPNNDTYYGACIWVAQNDNSSIEATGNTFNGDNAIAFNVGYTPVEESDNTDNTKMVVAKIGNAYYTSIQDAIEAAQDGETVRLIQNVKMDTKTLATQNDGYAVLVNVNGKKVTIDLNGKKITVNAAAADLANAKAKGKMLLTVFHADTNGELTLTDNTADKAGAVVVNVNDATVYSVFASESQYSDKSESGKLTVNAGNYTTVGKVSNAMFFADANEVITVNGGNFHCEKVSNTANYPWMFNTLGNNELHVTVNGGTFNVDINHQHRPFEVKVPETLAVKANDKGTWTVVPAEAYITEMLGATVNEADGWGHKVGYATIAEAIAAVNELGNKVSIAKDLELTEAVVVPADKTVVLDLNGKTITMEDASSATAALVKNYGNLTIMDGTEAKAGMLSFKTTTPSAANAYASNTISNYGVITIESGNVENLSVGGGACYALDNYAGSTATINGGKLTAEKTAVRIFNWTNGEEAKATINMNGGEIYSKNGYGINVNSGNAPFVALNIAGGTITTDYADYKLAVYVVNKNSAENLTINVTGGTFNGIFALNGVTAQTMKQGAVAVSGGTFEGVTCYEKPTCGFIKGGIYGSDVQAYCAEDYKSREESDEKWHVYQIKFDNLTIDDDCDEYINVIEREVGELTYVRYFTNTWQTIYLPFAVDVSDLTEAGLEVAYIYNASYKDYIATVDYVEIGKNSDIKTLAANYPYLIKAKEAGEKSIVVSDAKLMPTVVKTIECSSVFEKFVFSGNYNTIYSSNLDRTKGYFMLDGTWSRMEDLSPFRVYMQIEFKDNNASDFSYPVVEEVRMRNVGQDGSATGVEGIYSNEGSDVIFDLQGRRVLQPQKGGVYIINGKKVVY